MQGIEVRPRNDYLLMFPKGNSMEIPVNKRGLDSENGGKNMSVLTIPKPLFLSDPYPVPFVVLITYSLRLYIRLSIRLFVILYIVLFIRLRIIL